MSLAKYKSVQNATEHPRSTEYRLFAQVTRALMEIGDKIDAKAHETLHWNQRMWIALQTDLAADGNQLPDGLKAQLISLATWVDKYTMKVMQRRAPLAPLIQVNRAIMEGLASSAGAA
ncbi:MAG TPA: flagellar biosynthesis regulator FlaF [Candidatus Sulfotelmatobacter sp.]|jgi:flagellar protein FlaF|nr:flagellar biosynthesis regulator FlaF [Candidatus Sulfotelmatobacter sp.]